MLRIEEGTFESMTGSGRGAPNPLVTAIVNWRALSLKRLVHLDELQRTGRWRRHFQTEDAFEEALRNAHADAERWRQLADPNQVPIDKAAER